MTDRIQVMIDGRNAVRILRRILAGEEKAWIEGEALVKAIDERDEKFKKEQEELQAKRDKRAKSGRMNSGKFEIAPRVEGGVDYSAAGIVLARKGELRLVWRSGGSYFSGRGRTAYAPAELEVLGLDRTSTSLTNHFNKGKAQRLTPALIRQYRAQIDKYFGPGTSKKVEPLEATVVL